MKIIGVASWSGAGKTTLLAGLIAVLAGKDWRISKVKHAHHGFDIDRAGKDSHRHREAGASEVLIASERRWALMHENRDERTPRLADLLSRLSPVDFVFVEGFKRAAFPKAEIHRVANGKPFLFPELPQMHGLVSDVSKPAAWDGAFVDLDDAGAAAGGAGWRFLGLSPASSMR